MTAPPIVVMCGSSCFVDIMAVCAWQIERDECAITMGIHLLPAWYPDITPHHMAEMEGVAGAMDDLHLRKIDLATEIFVVNCGGYIGESTTREIAYAERRGLPIRYYENDGIGTIVRDMIAALESYSQGDP